jgi:transcriptional regulator with XRE-family HTH domain
MIDPQTITEAKRALGRQLAALREAAGKTQEQLAQQINYGRSTIANAETGYSTCRRTFWEHADQALHANAALLAGYDDLQALTRRHHTQTAHLIEQRRSAAVHPIHDQQSRAPDDADIMDVCDDELDALELARRVAASDVTVETLTRLEMIVDELAVGYATTPAIELLPRVGRHLAYVGRLMDGRATLAQRRRLLIIGAWLALIRATIDTDLRRDTAAGAWLDTSRQMAQEAEHAELRAWCLETRAWGVLGNGDFGQAVALSRAAQEMAPHGSSAMIQATAQEGRALARLGDAAGTRGVLRRIEKLVSALRMPERPEHHYRYDPGKATAYTATTLAWLGDPAAVEYARAVVRRMERPGQGRRRPRRAAIARLDLSLALLGADQPDEATEVAMDAITARMLVASNWWRATEVLMGVERSGIADAVDLREAYETFRPIAASVEGRVQE